MSALKKNIAKLTKQYGTSYSKLERKAGLAKHFISNILHDRSRTPNIDAVIKLAQAFDMSVDELVGLPPKETSYKTPIDNIDLFSEVVKFVMKKFANFPHTITFSDFIKTVFDIYHYSTRQNTLDTNFAEWCIESYLLKKS